MYPIFVSLLHRPLFIKFSLLTTKQIISPASSTRKKRAFLGLGRFSFLMVRWVGMLFWLLELYWFQKGAIEVHYIFVNGCLFAAVSLFVCFEKWKCTCPLCQVEKIKKKKIHKYHPALEISSYVQPCQEP